MPHNYLKPESAGFKSQTVLMKTLTLEKQLLDSLSVLFGVLWPN